MRSLGANKDEVGGLGAEDNSQDQFYQFSAEDHQHQYAEVAVELELLNSVTIHSVFSTVGAKVYKIGNLVSLYGVVKTSAPETDLIQLDSHFVPGSDSLPILFAAGGSGTPSTGLITLDSTGLISISIASLIDWLDLSLLRFVYK